MASDTLPLNVAPPKGPTMAGNALVSFVVDSVEAVTPPGFPSILIDRRESRDPDELFDVYDEQKDFFGFADISLAPVNILGNALSLTATVKPAIALNGDYRLVLAITEDRVHGTGAGYNQGNYYSGGNIPMACSEYDFVALPHPVPAAIMYYDFVGRKTVPSPEDIGDQGINTANGQVVIIITFHLPDGCLYTHINLIGFAHRHGIIRLDSIKVIPATSCSPLTGAARNILVCIVSKVVCSKTVIIFVPSHIGIDVKGPFLARLGKQVFDTKLDTVHIKHVFALRVAVRVRGQSAAGVQAVNRYINIIIRAELAVHLYIAKRQRGPVGHKIIHPNPSEGKTAPGQVHIILERTSMLVFPHCKINLGLFVTHRRADGYHDLETIFYPVRELKDALEMVPAKNGETSLHLSGKAVAGPADKNLVYKAWQLLAARFPGKVIPMEIYLHKIIPMGAGMGGGSSNGAVALRLINDLCKLELTDQALAEMALELGSDCPFFIYDTPQFATGRGEKMEPIPAIKYGITVVTKPVSKI
ncbi:GHMP kinase protein [Ostertagia ostertagi]